MADSAGAEPAMAAPDTDVGSLPFAKLAKTFEMLETSSLKGWKRRQMLFTDKLLQAYRVRSFCTFAGPTFLL